MPSLVEMMTKQRLRTAAGILRAHLVKSKFQELKASFVQWRSTIGMQRFLSATFKQAILAKAVNRAIKNAQRRSVIRHLHFWRQGLFSRKQQLSQHAHQGGLIESLMLDQKSFADCLEGDEKLV